MLRPAFPKGAALYCVTDRHLSSLSPAAQAEAFLAGGAKIVQYRDKEASASEFLDNAKTIRRLTREAGALFIVNDRSEAALRSDADGLHVGQSDERPARVRAFVGEKMLLGYSTHNPEQLRRAFEEPVDQISVGPIYETQTKKNADPATGAMLLAQAQRLSPTHPRIRIAAIGGITLERVPVLLNAAPTALFVVIGAILRQPDIAKATRAFVDAIALGPRR